MKFDGKHARFFNLFKPILLVSATLFLVALVVVSVWGFNAGFDFTGGTELIVGFTNSNIDITKDEDLKSAVGSVTKIITDRGVKINSFQTQGVYNDLHFVITFKTPSQEVMQDIRLKINEKFNDSEEFNNFKSNGNALSIIGANADLTRNTTEIDNLIVRNSYLSAISALAFSLALISIYACIRFKSAGGASIIIFSLFDILMTLVFVAISRIEINAYLFSLLGVILISSIFASVNFFLEVKEIYANPKYAESDNTEIAKMITGRDLSKNMLFYVFAYIACLILGVLNVGYILHIGLIAFAGLFVTFVSHTFMLPEFWSTVCKVRPIAKGAMLYRALGSSKEKVQIADAAKVETKKID